MTMKFVILLNNRECAEVIELVEAAIATAASRRWRTPANKLAAAVDRDGTLKDILNTLEARGLTE